MRDMLLVRIGEVAGLRCEITVRNVVLGELRLARRARPTRLGGTPRPTRHHLHVLHVLAYNFRQDYRILQD